MASVLLEDEFPTIPWPETQVGQKDRIWRERSKDACAWINLTAGRKKENGIGTGPTNAVNKMMYAIFDEFSVINSSDRRGLLRWLGRASALRHNISGAPPANTVRRTVDLAGVLLMQRWAAEAWSSLPDLDRPEWAAKLIRRICIDSQVTPSMQSYGWAPRPGGDNPDLSAQADLQVFFQGYKEQTNKQDASDQKRTTSASKAIVEGCMALRLFAAVTNRAYGTLAEDIEAFEMSYDHTLVDSELLRLIGSMVDRKRLDGIGASILSEAKLGQAGGGRRRL